MENCIFCKIISGEVPASKVFEDQNYLAFLPKDALHEGHVLVVPKAHYRWVWDDPNIGEYFMVCQKIVEKLRKIYKTEFIVGHQIGNEVAHAHVHLIPQSSESINQNFGDFSIAREMSEEEKKRVVEKFREVE